MKKQYFLLASLALGMAACTNDTLTPDEIVDEENNSQEEVVSNLQHAKLSSFNSSQSRVTVSPVTRAAEPGTLELVAEIANLSREGQIDGFTFEDRYLSATCVFYDENSGTYYTTYHMQGNNYNTQQQNETGGFIETFTIGEDGVPELGKVYQAANPSELSFDFNHLYFDHIPNVSEVTPGGMVMDYVGDYTADSFLGHRIIAVGHSSQASSKEGGKPNTKAIIARLNFDGENPSIDYATILTGDKLTDGSLNEDGNLMSLGDEDARDANCVVRKYNHYYVATRIGIAIVKGWEDELFAPEVDVNGHNYFFRTVGSVKHLSQPTFTSGIDFLMLDSDTPEGGLTAESSSTATIGEFALDTRDSKNAPQDITNLENFSWSNLTSPNKILFDNIDNITPMDGKNVLVTTRNITCAALGKGGLFINYPSYHNREIIKFSDNKNGTGSRPVNGLFVEENEVVDGRTSNHGFIYVANGACLTIIDAVTLDIVAEVSAYDSKAEENLASANYVYVQKLDTKTNGQTNDRLVTVAFGQEGVKVFRFVPPTLF